MSEMQAKESSIKSLPRFGQYYEVVNPTEIAVYISEHAELDELLIEAYPQILKYFGKNARAYLKLEADVEEHFQTLCVYIVSALNYDDAANQLHLMDEEWFVHEMPRIKANLLFDIEF